MTFGYGKDLEIACKQALNDMISYLRYEGLSDEEAYTLCSLAVDLKICKLVDIMPAVRASLPKAIFKSKIR